LRVKVAGRWLDGIAPVEVEEISTNRHGPERVLLNTTPHPLLRQRQPVQVYDDAALVWSGLMNDPDGDVGTYSAQGLYVEADRYPARDGSDTPSSAPTTAIDAAITKGLPWARFQAFSTSPLSSNLLGEFPQLDELLDAWTSAQDEEWRLTPAGEVEHYARPTAPQWLLAPGFTLGTTSDDYVSHLSGIRQVGQTVNTPSGTAASPLPVAVPEIGSQPAADKWGYRSAVVDLTDLGVISQSTARSILDGLRRKGRHRMGWTGSVIVTAGQITNMGGVTVSLTRPVGGDVMRLPRFWDTTQDYDNHAFADIWIDRTVYRSKDGTLELVPVGLSPRNFLDLAGTTMFGRYHPPKRRSKRKERHR